MVEETLTGDAIVIADEELGPLPDVLFSSTGRNLHERGDINHFGWLPASLVLNADALGTEIPAGQSIEDWIRWLNDHITARESGFFIRGATLTGDSWIEVFPFLTGDAIILRVFSDVLTGDAWIVLPENPYLTGDAIILRVETDELTGDAIIRRVEVGDLTGDAIIRRTQSGDLTGDAWILFGAQDTLTGDAIVMRVATGTMTGDAWIGAAETVSRIIGDMIFGEDGFGG